MADGKVSGFPLATSVNPTDVVYLVQGANDRKLRIQDLFQKIPNTPLIPGGVFGFGGTIEEVVDAGTITMGSTISLLKTTEPATVTITEGTYDGQLKILLMTEESGAMILENHLGVTHIVFSSVGHSVQLIWVNDAWWPVAGTATISL